MSVLALRLQGWTAQSDSKLGVQVSHSFYKYHLGNRISHFTEPIDTVLKGLTFVIGGEALFGLRAGYIRESVRLELTGFKEGVGIVVQVLGEVCGEPIMFDGDAALGCFVD